MARSSKIKVMISSRNRAAFPAGSGTTLSDIRQQLKSELEGSKLLGRSLFEVWINEDAPPSGAENDSWEKCMREVAECDVLLVLYDGFAGWTKAAGEVGICHAELMTGLSTAPGKVRLVELTPAPSATDRAEAERNTQFQSYVKAQSLFRGGTVATVDDLKKRAREALADAVVALTQAGVRDAARAKFYGGSALDWTRLGFVDRRAAMVGVLRQFLAARDKSRAVGMEVALPIEGATVCFRSDAIPAAMTIAAAREMVGQPFLTDHAIIPELSRAKATGPVHLIACHKTVTEAQALRLLGFPDATIVSAPFGVYVADDVQKIQVVLLANCRDEATTRHTTQRFFEWLEQTGEAKRMALRAKSRTKIIEVIAKELT